MRQLDRQSGVVRSVERRGRAVEQLRGKGMSNQLADQPRSMLRIEQVMERIQRGRSWIWEAVRRGEFPAPRRLSPRCTDRKSVV